MENEACSTAKETSFIRQLMSCRSTTSYETGSRECSRVIARKPEARLASTWPEPYRVPPPVFFGVAACDHGLVRLPCSPHCFLGRQHSALHAELLFWRELALVLGCFFKGAISELTTCFKNSTAAHKENFLTVRGKCT